MDRLGSKTLSFYLPIFYSNEEHMFRNQEGGVFIGRSEDLALPVLLSYGQLINPHIFITGITGSGKSYLMKSLIIKSIAILNARVFAIDITGEYADLAKALYACGPEPYEFAIGEDKFAYYNLSKLSEEEKLQEAERLLSSFIEGMRRRGVEREDHLLVVFDEAWKLLARNNMFELMLREGRKYKVGVVIASQLIEDLESALLSNIATLFVFRIQDKRSLELLAKNYLLPHEHIDRVQHLKQGSCMLIQVYKDKSMVSFFVDKVHGANIVKIYKIIFGDKMVEVSERDIRKSLERMGYAQGKILKELREEMSMQELINLLLENGMGKRELLNFLREIGLEDKVIANAFAEMLSEGYEERKL